MPSDDFLAPIRQAVLELLLAGYLPCQIRDTVLDIIDEEMKLTPAS